MEKGKRPLAQVEDIEELKGLYSAYSDRLLLLWVNVVTGPHRAAMAEVLKERGKL